MDELFLLYLNADNFSPIIAILGYGIATVYSIVILWVLIDIDKRTTNKYIKFLSIALILLLNIAGLVLYLLFRPHETIDERESRKLYNKHDLMLVEPGMRSCPNCFSLNKSEFIYCVICSTKLEFCCKNCTLKVEPIWHYCPYCKSELHEKESRFTWFTKPIRNFYGNIIARINILKQLIFKENKGKYNQAEYKNKTNESMKYGTDESEKNFAQGDNSPKGSTLNSLWDSKRKKKKKRRK